jgi:hypothetical protein
MAAVVLDEQSLGFSTELVRGIEYCLIFATSRTRRLSSRPRMNSLTRDGESPNCFAARVKLFQHRHESARFDETGSRRDSHCS